MNGDETEKQVEAENKCEPAKEFERELVSIYIVPLNDIDEIVDNDLEFKGRRSPWPFDDEFEITKDGLEDIQMNTQDDVDNFAADANLKKDDMDFLDMSLNKTIIKSMRKDITSTQNSGQLSRKNEKEQKFYADTTNIVDKLGTGCDSNTENIKWRTMQTGICSNRACSNMNKSEAVLKSISDKDMLRANNDFSKIETSRMLRRTSMFAGFSDYCTGFTEENFIKHKMLHEKQPVLQTEKSISHSAPVTRRCSVDSSHNSESDSQNVTEQMATVTKESKRYPKESNLVNEGRCGTMLLKDVDRKKSASMPVLTKTAKLASIFLKILPSLVFTSLQAGRLWTVVGCKSLFQVDIDGFYCLITFIIYRPFFLVSLGFVSFIKVHAYHLNC